MGISKFLAGISHQEDPHIAALCERYQRIEWEINQRCSELIAIEKELNEAAAEIANTSKKSIPIHHCSCGKAYVSYLHLANHVDTEDSVQDHHVLSSDERSAILSPAASAPKNKKPSTTPTTTPQPKKSTQINLESFEEPI